MATRQGRTRREFLEDVGRGMLIAGVGLSAAVDLGLTPAHAALEDGGDDRLRFGELEPLVGLLQETPADRLVPILVERVRGGTTIRELVAAAAMANARTFGGEDYVGFHTMMALAPALHMASVSPESKRALPVIKVLYRNTSRMQESGLIAKEVLHPVEPLCCLPEGVEAGKLLRQAVRQKDLKGAEATFATIAQGTLDEAFNALLWAVQDNTEVHRVVLPYRARDLMSLIGTERAHTLLRQSVHYCVKSECERKHTAEFDEPRTVLPKVLDQYHLLGRSAGTREADDEWVDHLARTFYESDGAQAADAAGAALAEGFRPDDVGQAIALAANQLVLRDKGRPPEYAEPGKPAGSVHGASVGVHACDSANAWRNMARVADARNQVACLILGAYQVAHDRVAPKGDFLHWPIFHESAAEPSANADNPDAMLKELDAAIRSNDQAHAAALAESYIKHGHPHRPAFDVLLRYAVSEDGALHAEKYYQTVSEEFASTRPAFRCRQLAALARVTASEYGHPAAGVEEACQILKV